MKKELKTETLFFKATPALRKQIEQYAKETERVPSSVIRLALSQFFSQKKSGLGETAPLMDTDATLRG